MYLFQASYPGNIKSRDSTIVNVPLGILNLFQDIQTPALVWTESHVKLQINHLKKEQLHPDCLSQDLYLEYGLGMPSSKACEG